MFKGYVGDMRSWEAGKQEELVKLWVCKKGCGFDGWSLEDKVSHRRTCERAVVNGKPVESPGVRRRPDPANEVL